MRHQFAPQDMPESIPVFPLPGALLLPHTRLPLHIFEPRYLAMLDAVLKTEHRLIGMVQPITIPEGKECGRLHQIGCAGRVSAFQETDDGRYMVTLLGVSRFRIKSLSEGFSPYLSAAPCWQSFATDLHREAPDEGFDRTAFLALLERYFAAAQITSDWDSLREADEEMLINSLAMLCPFDPEEKQALLESPTLQTRRETMVMLMEFSLHSGGEEGSLQ